MKKNIAVMHRNPATAAALVTLLTARIPAANLRVVTKVTEAQPGEAIACIGIPGYLNASGPVEVISVNTRYVADDEARKTQRELLVDENATEAAILAELGSSESFTVIPTRDLESAKSSILQARLAVLEATDDEAKAAAEAELNKVLRDTHPAFTL